MLNCKCHVQLCALQWASVSSDEVVFVCTSAWANSGWAAICCCRYQVQQSIKDLRFLIMCADRVFKHEGKLVAIGRDLPVRRRSSSIGRRSSLNLVEMVNRRLSLDSGPSGTSHNRTEAASGSADSVGRDQGGVDAFFPDGMWSYRKEREYMVFLFHDILIFCKPTYREKGQQMYEKRGLLTIRRVVDCRREEDPSSWLVFRVYGTIVELHPKLLWTQVCTQGFVLRAQCHHCAVSGNLILQGVSIIVRLIAPFSCPLRYVEKAELQERNWGVPISATRLTLTNYIGFEQYVHGV